MHPILFEFGPVKIYSYGLLVAAGFIAAALLAKAQARRQGMPAEKILNLCLCLVVSGILGARLLYILQNLDFYIEYPVQALMLYEGGLTFYGGLVLAVVCAIVFLKRERLPVFKTLDLVAPYLALAQGIGRIGCFLNGCCYGKPVDSDFAVYFPGEDIGRHPVQLYSSLNLLLIFIILRVFQARRTGKAQIPGRVLLLYFLLYSIARFLMEYLRGDNLPVFANLTLHQIISLGLFSVSGGLLWKRQRNFTLKSRMQMKAQG
jgi:phosphatidylglycerol:prolipoprotein diacylglycerol transferase